MELNQTSIKSKGSAKDFFLNLGAIVTLYTVIVSLINLLFTIINVAYPQITNGYNYYGSQSISSPVSILIIAFPILIVLMWQLAKQNPEDSVARSIEGGVREKNVSTIHRWLSYITLFLAGVTLVVDLITVLYYYLDGQELTTGFLLKVLVVFVTVAGLFVYYISDIRGRLTSGGRKIWRLVSAIIIVTSIIWGFSVLGSPRTQRLIKYDNQKVNDLENINSQINSFYYSKNRLPQSLDEVVSLNYGVITSDLQSNKPYEYNKKDVLSYELCAIFNKATKDSTEPNIHFRSTGSTLWTHPAGHYCFTQTINPSQYSGIKSI